MVLFSAVSGTRWEAANREVLLLRAAKPSDQPPEPTFAQLTGAKPL